MKRISTAVLTAALLSGAAIVAAPPAFAKKKEEAAPTGPQLSPAFGAALQKAKTAFAAKDDAASEAAVIEAEGLAKSDDEKYYAAVLRYALNSNRVAARATAANGVVDRTPLIAPLDAILASPKLPADQVANYAYERGRIAVIQKQYPIAIQSLTRARAAGSQEPNLLLLLADSKIQNGDIAGGMADFDALYATGKPMTDDQYRFIFAHANQAKMHAETVKWLQRWVTAMPSGKTWNDALTVYAVSQKPLVVLDKYQMLDVLRLMRQSHALADQNLYELFAQRLLNAGLPEETKAVVVEGKANGKIPAVSPANALATSATGQLTSAASLASLTTRSAAAANGQLSQQTADVYLGRGDYAKAITLYRQALAKGGVNADQVNTDLGIALALSGDKEGAKTAFGLVTTTPRSEIAGFWTVWLDHPPTS